jgi:hypothetical protein
MISQIEKSKIQAATIRSCAALVQTCAPRSDPVLTKFASETAIYFSGLAELLEMWITQEEKKNEQ